MQALSQLSYTPFQRRVHSRNLTFPCKPFSVPHWAQVPLGESRGTTLLDSRLHPAQDQNVCHRELGGTTPKSLVPQGFKSSTLKSRRREVSRKTRFKSEKTGKTGDFEFGEVRRYIRKTPQTLACSGVFVTVLDRLLPLFWRARRHANTNTL